MQDADSKEESSETASDYQGTAREEISSEAPDQEW
jgi:hypothetical protein